jgi:hypothetical protein
MKKTFECLSLVVWAYAEKLFIVNNLYTGWLRAKQTGFNTPGVSWFSLLLFILTIIIAIDALFNVVTGAFKFLEVDLRELIFRKYKYYVLGNVFIATVSVFLFSGINLGNLFETDKITNSNTVTFFLQDFSLVAIISTAIIILNIYFRYKPLRKFLKLSAHCCSGVLFIFCILYTLNFFKIPTTLNTRFNLLLGENKINNVYIEKDKLIKDSSPRQLSVDIETNIPIYYVSIPTALGIYRDEINKYNLIPDQQKLINDYYDTIYKEVTVIDVFPTLMAQKDDRIFKTTSDDLTYFGYYEIYKTIIRKLGFQPVNFSNFSFSSEGKFYQYGELYSATKYKPSTKDKNWIISGKEKQQNNNKILVIAEEKVQKGLNEYLSNHYGEVKYLTYEEFYSNNFNNFDYYGQILIISSS